MSRITLLHRHQLHRTRQLRWVLPLLGVLVVGAAACIAIVYAVGDREVSREFFRAHKTIHDTGELLRTGALLALALCAGLASFAAVWGFRLTHRIVRPVHTLHRALDALAAGDLGTRLELHRHDEFQEIATALNRVTGNFATAVRALREIAALVDELTLDRADRRTAGELERVVIALRDVLGAFRLEPERLIRENDPADAP